MGARLAMGGRMAESYGQGRTRGGASFVLDQLRDEILSLTLKPGTVLSRAELQERFELSSTPIRDALMRLQEEGLVDIFPQHATVVTAINTDHARQAPQRDVLVLLDKVLDGLIAPGLHVFDILGPGRGIRHRDVVRCTDRRPESPPPVRI